MLLSTSFVPVNQVTSIVPLSNFSDKDLNRVAELILKIEGVINPLVLRTTNFESYEVVDGHFEYYAATKAREIDPLKGEMIGAFIIEPKNEEVIQEQVELLRKRESGDNEIKQKLENLSTQVTQLSELVRRIENVLSEKQKPKRSKPQKSHTQTSEYDNMTVPQLKLIAKELKIERYSKMNKEQLIAAIISKKES